MLHPVGQRVADDADVVAGLQLQPGCGIRQSSPRTRPGRARKAKRASPGNLETIRRWTLMAFDLGGQVVQVGWSVWAGKQVRNGRGSAVGAPDSSRNLPTND